MGILESIARNKQEKNVEELLPLLHSVNAREAWARTLAESDIPQETERLKAEYADHGNLDKLLPDAFALVREAARRSIGERPYDVQILGGIVLHQGRIMELKTGEGKTLSSTAPAYLNALSGKSVHIVTVNDYLVEREVKWMGPIFALLGLTTGGIVHSLPLEKRKEAYNCDITYGTNNEFAFDYLRDNMRYTAEDKMQRGHHYCIIDEIDSILIDGARTPLIISGSTQDDTRKYLNARRVIQNLKECDKDPETEEYPEEPVGDYTIEEKSKKVSFTDEGLTHLEKSCINQKVFAGSLYDSENFEYIHYATQALRAQRLFHKDTHYVYKDGRIEIVDEFTGRILHGRRYNEGLHQAIEAKEGASIQQRSRTLASITFQNFFRMYEKISGMTGTAASEEKEFVKIYGLDVVVVPTNRPVIRDDADDVIYLNENDKFNAICDEIKEVNKTGQPILVGTVSIEKSERLSKLLHKRGIKHEVLNAKNHAREALIVAEAGAEGAVTIATNMAGRGTDIKLGGNPEFRALNAAASEAPAKPAGKARSANISVKTTASSKTTETDYAGVLAREQLAWLGRSAKVKESGGLYILGTERHESRRIDNQLRGRSGRQGDPGKSQFFLSMDDELMRLFGGRASSMKDLMQRVGMAPGMAVNHPMLNKAIENAQRKVEERNFEIRKHLLKYDDVLNEQRMFVYDQRNSLLGDSHILDRVISSATKFVQGYVQEIGANKEVDNAIIAQFAAKLKDDFFINLPIGDAAGNSGTQGDVRAQSGGNAPTVASAFKNLRCEEFAKRLLDAIVRNLRSKEASIGQAVLNQALRREYLINIDMRWQDHLENLEALREAVYLRSYAQKNPLLEYKLEGFQIFDTMLYEIRRAILRKLMLVRTEGIEKSRAAATAPQGQFVHNEMNLLSQRAQGGTPQSDSPTNRKSQSHRASSTGRLAGQQKTATIVRESPKVGRNDPCPCGSGKKYKHCHGA